MAWFSARMVPLIGEGFGMSEVEVARFSGEAVKRKRYIVQSRFTHPRVSSWLYDSSHRSKGKAIREAKRMARLEGLETRVLDTED